MFGFLILWFGLSIVTGVAANTRHRNGGGWFLLALLISPLFAGLLVLALPALEPDDGPVRISRSERHRR